MTNHPSGGDLSSSIFLAYTIPWCYLLSLYIFYLILKIILILDQSVVYSVFLILHYIPALLYVVHRIAVRFNIRNILLASFAFVFFPLHFILMLYYKIMSSLVIIKLNRPNGEDTASLINKIKPDNPLNTFIIAFTCVQVPLEFILQVTIYLNQRRHSTSATVLTLLNLILCLFLFTNGVVRYFRFETQNIHKYLLQHMRLKAEDNVKAERTYKKNITQGTKRTMAQFEVEQPHTEVTDSHSILFKGIVFVKWLLHNYIRVVSISLVLYYYPTFTIVFLAIQTIVAFLLLLVYSLKSQRKPNIGYNLLQSIVLNVCLIEYKLKLSGRKLIFIAYFLIVFAENFFFTYLWYFTSNWSRRYRNLFNATLLSLIICQILHFVLLFIYLVFYKPKTYEINYDNPEQKDEVETNESDTDEDRDSDNGNDNEFRENKQTYENVAVQNNETNKPTWDKNSTRNNVDRIRMSPSDTRNNDQTKDQSKQQRHSAGSYKVAFDNLIFTESEKHRPTSRYKELVNDADEQIIYSKSNPYLGGGLGKSKTNNPASERVSGKANSSLSPQSNGTGVNRDQRESWKFVVDEIDDQIHKSTTNLSKGKLHLSSDRLNKPKLNRSTDSLDNATEPRGSASLRQQQYPHNLLETSHTKTFKHTSHKNIDGTSIDMDDVLDGEDEEEIIMENKYVDSNVARRTSRYSSQEFVETRRMDESVYEERKMNVKTMNTTSLV
uniref:XK-related protein n=1 Tax=Cacopsylla melanoneura TaxID=428564 RepID=A0A8D8LRP6_9HEMI